MGLLLGIKYNIEGLLFALKSPKLIVLGMLRFTIVLALTFAFIGLVLYWHDDILNLVWTMPEKGFLTYLWRIVSWLVFIGLAVISMLIAYIVSQLFFCVFIMDYMSRITEAMVLGTTVDIEQGSYFSFFIYLMKQEIPRAVIPLIISFVILILGLITPVAPVIVFISSIAAVVFLAWDNTDLIPARRMVPFKDRFGFLKQNLFFHIGFGLLFLIPWINILFLSFAPVGATLYYLKKPDSEISRP